MTILQLGWNLVIVILVLISLPEVISSAVRRKEQTLALLNDCHTIPEAVSAQGSGVSSYTAVVTKNILRITHRYYFNF